MKLLLDWSDGHYSTRPLTDDEAAQAEAAGCTVAHVEDRVYEAYLRHCEQDGIWQALWRAISNEQYVQRREKELRPLEEADREISRLQAELARAERMAKYFENEWDRARGVTEDRWHTAEARSLNEYSCVFPQPGCDVAVLPTEWQDRARGILETYDVARAAEGLKVQGCCCEYGQHKKLDDATSATFRAAGFLVEHDAEVE